MDTKALKYILTIYEERSFTRAAEKLYISQPALSQYIRKLETTLRAPIFLRDGQTLTLTPAGEVIIRDGRQLLAQHEALDAKLAAMIQARHETIRFGISPFYSKYYLPHVMPAFSTQNPNIKLQVTEEISVNLEALAAEGRLDLCFVPIEPRHPSLIYRQVLKEEIYLAVPAGHRVNSLATPSTGTPYLELAHLRGEPFVMLRRQQKFMQMCNALLLQAGVEPEIAYETLNWDTVNVMVASGIGVGFVPEVLVRLYRDDKRLRYYRIAGVDTCRDYAVAYHKDQTLSYPALKLVDQFIDALNWLTA